MEVMLEIYRTLSVLDMEWKEKKYLGGLGGLKTNTEKFKMDHRHDLDGGSASPVDAKLASSIYYVETRARVDNIVVCSFFLFLNVFIYMSLITLNPARFYWIFNYTRLTKSTIWLTSSIKDTTRLPSVLGRRCSTVLRLHHLLRLLTLGRRSVSIKNIGHQK